MADTSEPVPGWNAHRYPQDPLRQPAYLFEDVPKCTKDCQGSVIQQINNRDHFKECMAEMVLLCIEAMRRTNASKTASKPLSLEYIADRVDVDDPCFGYVVRTKAEGMLQGFITVTTFTNWQKSFRWDSLHELAFYYDDSEDEDDDRSASSPSSSSGGKGKRKRQRQIDTDGTLARELESTVRLGDPHNEGIVWPRIAEISLLGGLGCGRTMVNLVLEELENLKATAAANYDYVVLQATDNSRPFYESIGFRRVGAVSADSSSQRRGQQQPSPRRSKSQFPPMEGGVQHPPSPPRSPSPACSVDSDGSGLVATAVPLDESSPLKPEALAHPSADIVSSPITVYEVTRGGEKPETIAKKHGVDVWDIIFLNHAIYKDISPKSKLMKGTILHLPVPPPSLEEQEQQKKLETPTKWFVAKENDTPRKIAKMFGVACMDLVEANRNRLPELQPASRLKAGTRMKVSNLHQEEDSYLPYCHWSFPDDAIAERGEPSYMMVYKLNRVRKKNAAPRPFRKSLAAPISNYSPAPLLMPADPSQQTSVAQKVEQQLMAATRTSPTKRRAFKKPPKPPKSPPTGLDIFKEQQRDLYPELREPLPQVQRLLGQRWNDLTDFKRARYNAVALEAKKRYDQEYEEYEVAHSIWKEDCDREVIKHQDTGLFSKVVKLRDDALSGKEYTYWFVLTYIPDLKWCHLAPMVRDGVFGSERKKSTGRPKWKLVDEELCKELDISSFFCIPVKSKAMKKTADADKEEWDIQDDGTDCLSTLKADSLKSCDVGMALMPVSRGPIRKQPLRARSATKPLDGKNSVLKKTGGIVDSLAGEGVSMAASGLSSPSKKRKAPTTSDGSPGRARRSLPLHGASPMKTTTTSLEHRSNNTPPQKKKKNTPTKKMMEYVESSSSSLQSPPRPQRGISTPSSRQRSLPIHSTSPSRTSSLRSPTPRWSPEEQEKIRMEQFVKEKEAEKLPNHKWSSPNRASNSNPAARKVRKIQSAGARRSVLQD